MLWKDGMQKTCFQSVLNLTKNRNQNLIGEAKFTEDIRHHSPKTTAQPLTDANLVWHTGRIELPHNAFQRWWSAVMFRVLDFSIQSRSFFYAPFSDKIAGVLQQETNCSTPIRKELVSIDGPRWIWTAEVVRQMKRGPPTLLCSPTNGNKNGAQVIIHAVSKETRSVC